MPSVSSTSLTALTQKLHAAQHLPLTPLTNQYRQHLPDPGSRAPSNPLATAVYAARLASVHGAVQMWLEGNQRGTVVIVGSGLDPLGIAIKDLHMGIAVVEVDFQEVHDKKMEMYSDYEAGGVVLHGCDLREDLSLPDINTELPQLVVTEVSLSYLPLETSTAVVSALALALPLSTLVSYESQLPPDPTTLQRRIRENLPTQTFGVPPSYANAYPHALLHPPLPPLPLHFDEHAALAITLASYSLTHSSMVMPPPTVTTAPPSPDELQNLLRLSHSSHLIHTSVRRYLLKPPPESLLSVSLYLGTTLISHSLLSKHHHLHALCTHPSHLRQGHARRMLSNIISRARDIGVPEVFATTPTIADGAVKLYESFGFERAEITEGGGLTLVKFKLSLDEGVDRKSFQSS